MTSPSNLPLTADEQKNGYECRKCGSTKISHVYISARDVLKCVCLNCTFRWFTLPLDAVEGRTLEPVEEITA